MLGMRTAELRPLTYDIDTDFRRSLLESIALFRGIGPEVLSDLLPQCARVDVREGDVLLSPQRPNRCVYVVLSGRLSVHLGALDTPRIADLGPGTCAGEMSLIEDKAPSAFVVAAEDSHLMVIRQHLLWQMADRSHVFCKNLLMVLSERVRSDHEFIASSLGVLRQAERNAQTDALTGLGNRHWMQVMFEREVTRARQNSQALCLMMIDVDNFKTFNDQYGHVAGDRVLAAVGDTLREFLRPTDLIARFGGDEFSILLPDVTLDQAREAAERLLARVAAISPPNLNSAITISVGIARLEAEEEVADLVQRADSALYDAKERGRNRIAVGAS
jgi:diguanylate cyclase (GGDEF)-like protein